MKHAHFLALALALSTGPQLFAQCTGFDPRLGSPLGLTGTLDQYSPPQLLGWSGGFEFPSGTTATQIIIGSHGRIFPDGASVTPFPYIIDLTDFRNEESIACYWADIVPAAGDIYFFTDPAAAGGLGEAVITWLDSEPYPGVNPAAAFTMQLIIRGDHSFSMIYGNNVPSIPPFPPATAEGIIGTSDGVDASTTAEVDFSNSIPAAAGSVTSPSLDAMLFEEFAGGADDFDLFDLRLDWTPLGGPGGTSGYIAIGSVCQFAFVQEIGVPCNFGTPQGPPVAYGWDPNGSGGYTVGPSAATFDSVNLGTSISPGNDSLTTVPISFSFVFPGGSSTDSIDIDANGTITPTGTLAAGDFTPDITEFLTEGPCIAPLWDDLEPSTAGDIRVYDDGVSKVNITWLDTIEFGQSNDSITFQVQLDGSDNSWDVVYQSVGDVDDLTTLIGCTDGGRGPIPAESDLSAGIVLSGSEPTVYEIFYGAFGEQQDLQTPPVLSGVDLNALSLPELGTMFMTDMTGIAPTATSVTMLLGFTDPVFPLTNIWPTVEPNCLLRSLGEYGTSAATYTAGQPMATWNLDLTSVGASAIGLPVKVQGLVVDPGVPWAAELLLTLTNGLDLIIGV